MIHNREVESSTVPLLITTAINAPAGLKGLVMTGSAQRLVATKCGIFFWASQKVKRIVIADATSTKVLSDEDVKLLNGMGCSVEQIAYAQNVDETLSRGRGWGEGKLVEFAIKNSGLLAGADSFFKCTGKVVCRNFAAVLGALKSSRSTSAFWLGSYTGLDLRYVDLRFYYCSRRLFLDVVLPGYDLQMPSKEYDFAEGTVTSQLGPRLTSKSLIRPQISGFSGGFDAQYPEFHLGDLEREFPCLIETQ